MIVCSCNVLSDGQIRATLEIEGAAPRTPGQVYRCLGCSPQCGRCARTIKAILDSATAGACAASACSGCPMHQREADAAAQAVERMEALLEADILDLAALAIAAE